MKKLGYVLNVFDSLNYDIFIIDDNIDADNDVDKSDIVTKEFTYCVTNNIMDPCLYDTQCCLPYKKPLDIQSDDDDNTCKQVTELNKKLHDFNLNAELKKGKSLRCHTKDIRFRNNARLHHDFYISKKMIIQWIDYTNGFVLMNIFKTDPYNRLIVDLYDPLTHESFKTYLMSNFPTIFCQYQQFSITVKLSEMDKKRSIPRPRSFMLRDYVNPGD